MEEKSTQIRRKRRNSAPPEKNNPRDFSWILPSRRLQKIFVLGLLLVDLYLLSCIFPDLSGNLGRRIYQVLYRTYGFCMVLPLFHGAYQCLAHLLGWHVENLRYQVLGTASLFLSCELFFGLTELYGVVAWKPPFLAGTFFREITLGLLRGVGLFGTFILAMGGILFSLLCYGLSFSDRFHSLYALLGAIWGGIKKFLSPSKKNADANAQASEEASFSKKNEEKPGGNPSEAGTTLEEVRIIRRRTGDFSSSPETLEEVPKGSAANDDDGSLFPDSGNTLPESSSSESLEVSENSEELPFQAVSSAPVKKERSREKQVPPQVTSEDVSPEQHEPDGLEMFWEDSEEAENEPLTLPLQVEPGRFPPPLELLGPEEEEDIQVETEELLEKGKKIVETLSTFGIEASLVENRGGTHGHSIPHSARSWHQGKQGGGIEQRSGGLSGGFLPSYRGSHSGETLYRHRDSQPFPQNRIPSFPHCGSGISQHPCGIAPSHGSKYRRQGNRGASRGNASPSRGGNHRSGKERLHVQLPYRTLLSEASRGASFSSHRSQASGDDSLRKDASSSRKARGGS